MESKEYSDWLGTFCDAEKTLSAMHGMKPSFRVNTLKIPVDFFDEISSLECERPPWSGTARIYDGNLQLGSTFEYFLGYLHPQSLSSMIPPLVLAPEERDFVLDIAASPGSKSTQLAALMNNKGVLVANDMPDRLPALASNIYRSGALNCIMSARDAIQYPLKGAFDKVLLDAPCSALGSHLSAIERFSIRDTEKLVWIQKKMVLSAYDALKPKGTLVYSTCTFSPMENEGVISHLLSERENAKLEKIKLDIPHDSGIGKGLKNCWRVYPQHMGSEGFFIAKITKKAPSTRAKKGASE